MPIEVKVPVLPESVSDATIASWHKKAGDAVKRDENLLDLETDKVVLEVPSPVDGVLKEIKFAEECPVKFQEEPKDALKQHNRNASASKRLVEQAEPVRRAQRLADAEVDVGGGAHARRPF